MPESNCNLELSLSAADSNVLLIISLSLGELKCWKLSLFDRLLVANNWKWNSSNSNEVQIQMPWQNVYQESRDRDYNGTEWKIIFETEKKKRKKKKKKSSPEIIDIMRLLVMVDLIEFLR